MQRHHRGGMESRRQIARAVGVGKSSVADRLRRAQAAGITDWGAIEALDKETLGRRLYPGAQGNTRHGCARCPTGRRSARSWHGAIAK